MKKTLFMIIALSIIAVSFFPTKVLANSDINVVIDNFNLVNFPDQRPFIDSNNKTLVPVRFVAENLGAEVSWNSTSRIVTILFEGRNIEIPIGSNFATIIDGTRRNIFDMGTKAVIFNTRTMVPLRFVSEALGSLVIWEGTSKTVFIERIQQLKPDKELINKFNEFEADKYSLISSGDNYQTLLDWSDSRRVITSTGRFSDYLIELDDNDFEDTFYFEFETSNPENVSWISIYFSTDEAQSNFFYYDITPDVLAGNNTIAKKSEFEIGEGNPTWSNVKYFRIAMQSKSGETFSLEPQKLSTYSSPPPMITLWFDDGWEDNFTNAFQITSRIDPTIRGAIGLVGTLIGQERYLKRQQITNLSAAGWEFVNHSYTHPNLATLTKEEIRNEIERNFNIVNQYDKAGSYHFVVPYSSVNSTVLDIIKETSLSARYNAESYDVFPVDRYNLGFFEVTNKTTFEEVRKVIEEAIENRQWVGLLFHRIEDPAEDRYSYGTQEFETLIYYLRYIKNEIQVVTPSEAFEILGMPIVIKD